jgi:hypothetical protein
MDEMTSAGRLDSQRHGVTSSKSPYFKIAMKETERLRRAENVFYPYYGS